MTKKESTDLDKRSYLIGYSDGVQSKSKDKEKCKWSTEGDADITIWHETSCNQSFFSYSGSYKDVGFNFCPYCGKNIEEVKS